MEFEIKDETDTVQTSKGAEERVIPAVVDVGAGNVEVRARLEDGRLVVLTVPKGNDQSYHKAVSAYIAEHLPEDPA